MGAIRGHQAKLKLFKNGQPANIINVTSFDINQDSDFSRSFYVGNKVAEGDQACLGWSGSIDVEVTDNSVEELIDSIVAGNKAGIGVDEISLVTQEDYPNGQSSSYVYFDMQLKMSKKTGGMNEKVTKRLDFQASDRQIL